MPLGWALVSSSNAMFIHVGDLNFFYTQITAAKRLLKIDTIPVEAEFYLVNLLYAYATNPPESFSKTLVDQFSNAINMPDKWKFVAYKGLGDNAMLKGGVFEAGLSRYGLSVWYCVDMGRNGYSGASANAPNKFIADLYRTLSDNMYDCIRLTKKAASITEAKVDGLLCDDMLEDF